MSCAAALESISGRDKHDAQDHIRAQGRQCSSGGAFFFDLHHVCQSYRKQFPALFSDEEPSDALREHFRYPEDLFRIQTDMWGRYRINGASEFYDAAGAWAVAQDPGNIVGQVAQEQVIDEQGVLIKRID